MKTIEEYAIELVTDGAESCAEDDLNESGDIAEEDHDAAMDLALEIVRAIRENPAPVLAMVGRGGNDRPSGEDRTDEPADGTILAADDFTEAWSRSDSHAAAGDYGDRHWYPFNNDDYPLTWADLPPHIKNGVRLVVADSAEVTQ